MQPEIKATQAPGCISGILDAYLSELKTKSSFELQYQSSMGDNDYPQSTRTIILLCCCLSVLMLLLVYFYKKLNKETEGEYTIRRMMFKEGGIRDQTRDAALALRTRLRELRPGSDSHEDGEEIQVVRDEEAQLMEGDSQGSDTERSSEEEDDEEQNVELRKGDSAAHCSVTSEGPKAREQTRLMDQPEAHVEPEVKRAEKEEVVESQGEGRGGSGLLINLKQFSGSAIWSEEEKIEREVTSL